MPARYEEMPPELAEFFQTVRGPNSRELLIDQNMFVEQALPASIVRDLTEEEMNRYREPFLDPSSREPVYATPGAIVLEPVVEWCKQNLSNLTTVHIGPGAHYLQEDNPHLIGSELAKWYGDLPG